MLKGAWGCGKTFFYSTMD
ncbi:MAG: hypothetical protein ACLTSS_05700 [Phocaeicola coprocola]